jgi:hypothetical protein
MQAVGQLWVLVVLEFPLLVVQPLQIQLVMRLGGLGHAALYVAVVVRQERQD